MCVCVCGLLLVLLYMYLGAVETVGRLHFGTIQTSIYNHQPCLHINYIPCGENQFEQAMRVPELSMWEAQRDTLEVTIQHYLDFV